MDKSPEKMHADQRRMFNVIKSVRGEFKPKEAELIFSYLSIFNLHAVEAITNIFLMARRSGVPLSKVLKLVEKEYKKNWSKHSFTPVGDPNLAGALGNKNRASLCRIHRACGIPLPEFNKKREVPKGPFVVETNEGPHRFGRAYRDGYRSMQYIGTDGREYSKLVKVIKLVVGEESFVIFYEGDFATAFLVLSVSPEQTS